MADRPKLQPATSTKDYAIHPAGPVGIVLVDVIDLGVKVDTPMGASEPKAMPKGVLVWQSTKINPDTNKPFEPWKEFTLSAGSKANLRKLVDAWLGKAHTDEEATAVCGALDTLVGKTGLANIVHRTSRSNRVYAEVQSVMPLPDGMVAPKPVGYQRAKWWEERKAEYQKGYEKFLADQTSRKRQQEAKIEDFPPILETDDNDLDLPF